MKLIPVIDQSPTKLPNVYEVAEDVDYGLMHVPQGFQYDGATLPPFLWPVIGSPFHPRFMRAALLHDWIYHTHELSKAAADDMLLFLLCQDGVNLFKAKLIYLGVKLFGQNHWVNTQDDLWYMDTLRHQIESRGQDPMRYGYPVKPN